ncbi:cyclic nucleotide-binding protein [Ectothiorhodospira haloalkaliphila]|uniref:Cyclic nucleotide-binding protein n=1 Tax=Ectothiorhodospira haloalkaliphila TaxID=421628 RepID=W8L4Q8_9GAMM|nr:MULTISPECIES: DUF294 nucleotidyltransferase-like domain-containing protein [Ectothiorhodospira]AHK78895.1 cyclic nucleotide-binding protein [Ectothiorhodospira haloalkaliphila]MCG5493131.1 DUF294 nucleotidyltransferase-like domain-containing protein [Ectothiorhodospira variabilis]MCG5502460.1 DUF294 nucleotidyltransferase-like domain-containing protein [Ectothiorhodospira variabilis]MCG5505774.1 DUF294 nucleotidyltransferase-like domain-containing protein [Ectothiorhodospira variabilis]
MHDLALPTEPMLTQILQAPDHAALRTLAAGMPRLQMQWVDQGATGDQVGQRISAFSDALTRRAIELAETELGPAPMGFAWVACGSQGRCEQTVHTDQDNALILARPPTAAERDHFHRLAERVTGDLDSCGLHLCIGGVMARNEDWQQPVAVWQRYFLDWIRSPALKSVMLAQNFLDLRTIHGDPSLLRAVRERVTPEARNSTWFISTMAREALKDSPPRSPLWRLGLRCPAFWFTRARPLDLKRRGIMPIVSLARLLAVAHGLAELHTRERLEATIRLGTISPSAGEELIRAWDLITTLRVRQHARLIRAKRPLDNRVESGEFSADERKRLCRAFAQVRFMQRSIGRHYLGGLPT